jgi:hypothetical protein
MLNVRHVFLSSSAAACVYGHTYGIVELPL